MIVFDSSTLILLAKAEFLDDFIGDYDGKVLIPREVEIECCDKKNSFDALLIRKRVQEKKILVAKISNTELCGRLMLDFRICRGEAEALILVLETQGKLVATDDKNAIKACKVMNIPFTAAMAILVRMTKKGTFGPDRARAILDALIKYARYSDTLIKEAKKDLK